MEIGKGNFSYANCELGFTAIHAMAMVEWIAWLECEMNAECVAHCHGIVYATDTSGTPSVGDMV